MMKKNKEIDFMLSFNNIQDIDYNKYDADFTIVVDGKRYSTPRIVADLLSPKIRKLHYSDASINELCINTNTNAITNGEDCFSDFIRLSNFNLNHLDSKRRELFSTYFLKLGNIDEYFSLQLPDIESLTVDEAISCMQSLGQACSENLDEIDRHNERIAELVTFIASHFYDVSTDSLVKLTYETLHEIIYSPSLIVRDEDSLLDAVVMLYENDRSYSDLFSSIVFANLKEESIEKFVEAFPVEEISSDIWRQICDCFLLRKKNDSKGRRYLKGERSKEAFTEFRLEKGNEFNGIMRYLTEKTGGNIHDNGTVKINSNSIANSDYHPKNSVDYENNDNFYASESNNTLKASVCFDFKDRRVQLENYSIKSTRYNANREHLRNWVVEASNDGEDFEEIDCRKDDATLNGPDKVGTFSISKENKEFYRFIRIRQTGYSWWGYPECNHNQFYIKFIEFFGKLSENTKEGK